MENFTNPPPGKLVYHFPVQFHEVFFAEGTWTFLWTDSLIRMFPARFWQDASIYVGGASVLEAGALAWSTGRIK